MALLLMRKIIVLLWFGDERVRRGVTVLLGKAGFLSRKTLCHVRSLDYNHSFPSPSSGLAVLRRDFGRESGNSRYSAKHTFTFVT